MDRFNNSGDGHNSSSNAYRNKRLKPTPLRFDQITRQWNPAASEVLGVPDSSNTRRLQDITSSPYQPADQQVQQLQEYYNKQSQDITSSPYPSVEQQVQQLQEYYDKQSQDITSSPYPSVEQQVQQLQEYYDKQSQDITSSPYPSVEQQVQQLNSTDKRPTPVEFATSVRHQYDNLIQQGMTSKQASQQTYGQLDGYQHRQYISGLAALGYQHGQQSPEQPIEQQRQKDHGYTSGVEQFSNLSQNPAYNADKSNNDLIHRDFPNPADNQQDQPQRGFDDSSAHLYTSHEQRGSTALDQYLRSETYQSLKNQLYWIQNKQTIADSAGITQDTLQTFLKLNELAQATISDQSLSAQEKDNSYQTLLNTSQSIQDQLRKAIDDHNRSQDPSVSAKSMKNEQALEAKKRERASWNQKRDAAVSLMQKRGPSAANDLAEYKRLMETIKCQRGWMHNSAFSGIKQQLDNLFENYVKERVILTPTKRLETNIYYRLLKSESNKGNEEALKLLQAMKQRYTKNPLLGKASSAQKDQIRNHILNSSDADRYKKLLASKTTQAKQDLLNMRLAHQDTINRAKPERSQGSDKDRASLVLSQDYNSPDHQWLLNVLKLPNMPSQRKQDIMLSANMDEQDWQAFLNLNEHAQAALNNHTLLADQKEKAYQTFLNAWDRVQSKGHKFIEVIINRDSGDQSSSNNGEGSSKR